MLYQLSYAPKMHALATGPSWGRRLETPFAAGTKARVPKHARRTGM
jgi:hypothetical protein